MIDIQHLMFDTIASGVATSRPDVCVTDVFDEGTASFPCITVEQKNNIPYRRMNTAASAENYATITFQVTAYSDKQDTAKSECLTLLNLVDGIIQEKGFRRTYLSEAFNISRTIFRRYARYEAIVRQPYVVDPDTANEKTVYEVYRR
ncbi:MAG: hypothetical protein IIZ78_28495 [Clostridiales bacterium]|nr:hypothetical protein [Clostridiales bacterium]